MKPRSALLLLALGSALLAGCGGGEGESAEAEIRATLLAAAMAEYPAACTRYNTQRSLEQTTKLEGVAAVRACEQSALEEWSMPTSVQVSRIAVEGERARAQIAFEGGINGGQTMLLALREVEGGWKVDETLAFVVFDRDRFVLEQGRELMRRAGSVAEADELACLVGQLDALDDEGLEALVLDPSMEPVIRLLRPCEPRGQEV